MIPFGHQPQGQGGGGNYGVRELLNCLIDLFTLTRSWRRAQQGPHRNLARFVVTPLAVVHA